MATKTTNLNLTKYDYSDVADIVTMSNNMDIIDREVANRSKLGHKHEMTDIEGLSLQAENVTIKDTSNLFDSPNVEGALKELFTNVSDGKSILAKAITDKGVTASANDSFATLANKISQIISALLNIPFPNFNVNIGTVDATFDTLESTFKEFRIQGQDWQSSNVFRRLEGNRNYVFEAKYGGNRVATLSLVTPKANQAKPNTPTASNIDGDSITVTAPVGCMIRFNGNNFNSPHTFRGLNISTIYEFYSFIPATDKLNESPLSNVLRVQTLDKAYLFRNGEGILSDKSKWVLDRGLSNGNSYFRVGETIRLEAENDLEYSVPDTVIQSAFVDFSNSNKLVIKVSKFQISYYGNHDKGKVSVIDNNSILDVVSKDVERVGTYELNVSSLKNNKIRLRATAQPKNRTVIEISEIYLTN